jgi:hypothetical protein
MLQLSDQLMLAKIIRASVQVTLHRNIVSRSLIHQLQPMLMRLVHCHEALGRVIFAILSPPVSLLRRHIGSRNDTLMRINQP